MSSPFVFIVACAVLLLRNATGFGAETHNHLDNGHIRLGIDTAHGGAIGFLADAKTGTNVINRHDYGRWLGQSYYAGPQPFGEPHPGWRGWPWNPVSAGDVYGHPSQCVEVQNDGTTLYVRSIPKQWALNNVAADCELETWITLEGRSAHVRNRLTNRRNDEPPLVAMDQELPFAYAVGTLHRLKSYTGAKPFTQAAVTEIPPQPAVAGRPQWSTVTATEHWVALVNDDDWGLGVIHPGVVRFLGGFYGAPGVGGPLDDATGYIAAVRKEMLDPRIVYDFRYTLVLDSLAGIRHVAQQLRPRDPLPQARFAHDRQHWWMHNAADDGVPLQSRWRLRLNSPDPQLYGPEGCWPAAELPSLAIRAAYRTRHTTARLFWSRADRPGFPIEQSVTLTIVPDGTDRTYMVDLAAAAEYRGTITQFRFDPIEDATPGDTVELESIIPGTERDGL